MIVCSHTTIPTEVPLLTKYNTLCATNNLRLLVMKHLILTLNAYDDYRKSAITTRARMYVQTVHIVLYCSILKKKIMTDPD